MLCRYSDFKRLAGTINPGKRNSRLSEDCLRKSAGLERWGHSEDSDSDVEEEMDDLFHCNSLTSWSLLQKKMRWFRCLRAEYLNLKTWLLERFLHDVLFESEDGEVLRKFVEGQL